MNHYQYILGRDALIINSSILMATVKTHVIMYTSQELDQAIGWSNNMNLICIGSVYQRHCNDQHSHDLQLRFSQLPVMSDDMM
jgi:hypothetical protein